MRTYIVQATLFEGTEYRDQVLLKKPATPEDKPKLLHTWMQLMSFENGVNPHAPNPSTNSNFTLLSVLGRERLTDPNYMNWMRNLRFTLRYENKEYVLDEQIPIINDDSTQEKIEAHQKHYDDANKVSCAKASKEHLDVVKSRMAYKPKPGASICAFVLEMKGYFNKLESLNMLFDTDFSINIILSGLPADYNQFVLSYQMSKKETSIMELHSLLQTAEKERLIIPTGKERPHKESLIVGLREVESEIAPTSDLKEAVCFYCNTKGHWKRSCPKYLKDLKDGKGLKESKRLKHGELNLIMGNRKITPVRRVGKFELMLKFEVRINLNNSSPCKGIYETVECISNDGNMILNIGSSNELDKSKLWHSRLGHVNKKRIAQLQNNGVLESFDFKLDDVYESCLLGKMTKSPFTRTCERGEGLLDLVHTDVCGPFRSAIKDRKCYHITFTDDFSRYGYVYLIKHKSNTFEVFKRYQNEVENQLGRTIKLTPPRTPQLNGVAERRNRTLLDMVRSMMCRATLPISFWEESCGYLFYKPKDNVVFVARRGVFLKREMISKEDSGSKIDLEEIQESVDEEHIINTNTQQEVVTPDDISLPIRKTISRVSKPSQDPQFYYGFHIEKDKISDSTLTELNKPANYKEAMAIPEAAKWKEAIKSEIQSMYDNKLRIWLTLHPVLRRWDVNGSLRRRRTWMEKYTLIKLGWLRKMDVKTAFLNGKLTEDMFMAQPEGFENEKYPKRVCKLQKAIYGLKQASRSWNLYFHEKLTQFGFSRSEDESCVYVKVSGNVVVFMVLYVDDILLIGNDIPTLQSVKDWLGRCFAIKDLGDSAYILGIKIYRDRTKRLIGLSQDTYLDKILKRFKMKNSKKGNLPLHHGIKISKDICLKIDDELDKMSRVPYASAIGSIIYAMTCTRPDVLFALSMVSQHQQNPGEGHLTAVKNILRYLRNTKDMFLVYGGEKELKVTGYCDDGWQTDKDDSRPHSGWDIRSEDNPADPFTKALAKSKHDELAKSIGLKDKIEF
ncbi:retrotransposon protein, putative, ty1-copia subclass [Tanacetum coccineum]